MSPCPGWTYTVPAIGLLLFVARPFLCRLDVMKMSLISAAAVAYAKLWDDDHAWCHAVPQTTLTLLWSLFCFRWTTPCLYFNFDRPSYRLIRWTPISVLGAVVVVVVVAAGHDSTGPEMSSSSDLGTLLCRSFPAFAFLWFGAGNFFVKRIVLSTVAIVVPTAYLCWADGTCRLGRNDDDGRPVGENVTTGPGGSGDSTDLLSCFAVNALLVLAVNGYDKAAGMMEAYTFEFPRQLGFGPGYLDQLFSAFITPECSMPADVVEDIRQCFHVLKKESTTVLVAIMLLFQGGCRLDIMISYVFARMADEMFDNNADPIKLRSDLKLGYEFINELYADRKTIYHVKRKPEVVKVDWTKYQSRFNNTELAVFRAFARIAFFLPAAPFVEMFDAYKLDVDGKVYETEEDLMTYTDNLGGINSALAVYVILFRDHNDKYYNIVEKGKKDIIIQKVYKIGSAVQIVNIARDIITDSLKSGRCYIPFEYMEDDQKNDDVKALRQDKDPMSVGDFRLKRYANMLISLSNKHHMESEDVIRSLPIEYRSLILAFIDMYRGYISAIQSSPIYPVRAKLSQWSKIKIGLYSLYVRSLHYVI